MMVSAQVSQAEELWRSCAIACLRAPFDADAAKQARVYFLDPGFDWSGFFQFIYRERVSPLVYHNVGSWEEVPSEWRESLQRVYVRSAWVSSLRVDELEKILSCFQIENIPVLIMKGAALAQTLYEKTALRPMTDMDLLIHAEDMERAQQILLSLGYDFVVSPSIPKEFESEVAFHKPGQFTWRVELHSSLFNVPHRLTDTQMGWFWENRTTTGQNGREMQVFTVEALLLHLSAHLWLHHGGGDLLGEHDIYQVIRQNQARINWETILSIGKDFEFLLPLQKVLPELAVDWRAPVPGDVLARLARMSPSVREKRKFNKFWGDDQNYAETLFAGTMSYPDWKSRLRYARLIIFPPAVYIKERYRIKNNWLIPFFYAYRLLSRAGQQVNRILQKNGMRTNF